MNADLFSYSIVVFCFVFIFFHFFSSSFFLLFLAVGYFLIQAVIIRHKTRPNDKQIIVNKQTMKNKILKTHEKFQIYRSLFLIATIHLQETV